MNRRSGTGRVVIAGCIQFPQLREALIDLMGGRKGSTDGDQVPGGRVALKSPQSPPTSDRQQPARN